MSMQVLRQGSSRSLRTVLRGSIMPSHTGKIAGGVRYASTSFDGMSNTGLSTSQIEVRESTKAICKPFSDEFWMEKDLKGEYAPELHRAMADAGFLGICMPEELGGTNLGISEAATMVLTIAESGAGMAGVQSLHASVYATVPLCKFGTDDQKARYLPGIIDGSIKVCFGVTEPDAGLDTLSLKTKAVKKDDETFIVDGKKVWITNAKNAHRMVLLARTSPPSTSSSSSGLSLFFANLDEGRKSGAVELTPLKKMGGKAIDSDQVFMTSWPVQARDLIGKEGDGFKTILYGMNAERCLLAGEALGLGYAALRRAVRYANERTVFGREIGKNQGIQHPLAKSWCELEAAKMLMLEAARGFDRVMLKGKTATSREKEEVGGLCNAAKYLAAEAAHNACDQAILTHGGMGYSSEFHVERYLRESYVPRIAPVSREMILNYISQRVLGLPKSY